MPRSRVSLIITSYNQEEYLREAIDSALQQTVQPWEIIIADDCSRKDASQQLIERYIRQHPGWVRGIFQERNVGIPKNRNAALRAVTGEYVAVLDGDDRLLPRFIEAHRDSLARHPEAGASYSDRYNLTPSGRHVRRGRPEPSGNILAYVAAGRPGILRSLVARYDLVREAGFLDEAFYHHDGYILALRLAGLTRFTFVNEPLMEKREHGKGTSKGISPAERVCCFQQIFEEVIAAIAHLPRKERDRIRRRWERKIFQQGIRAQVEGGKNGVPLLQMGINCVRHPDQIGVMWKLARSILDTR